MASKHQKEGESLSREATTLGQYPTKVQQSRPHNSDRVSDSKQLSGERIYEPAIFEEDDSPSPRDVISSARRNAGVRGPKFYKLDKRPNPQQLPKLIGVARERFKVQKMRIEQWQTENGITPGDQEMMLEKRRAIQKLRKETRRRKKLNRRSEQPRC